MVPDSKPDQLRVVPSTCSCTFKPPSSPGKLDGLGLNPVPKVRVRPTVMKKKKPSALDKQYRHVALLQRHNRQAAQQHQQQQLQQQQMQQQLSEFSHQLRTSILAGNADVVQQTWQPAAAAAKLQELQATLAEQSQQLKQSLPPAVDPSLLGSGIHSRSSSHAGGTSAAAAAAAGDRKSTALGQRHSKQATAGKDGSKGWHQRMVAADNDEDVDSFLDGLLQQAAAAITSGTASSSSDEKQPSAAARTQNSSPQKQPSAVSDAAADTAMDAHGSTAAGSRPDSAAAAIAAAAAPPPPGLKQQQEQQRQAQKVSSKSRPAWALTEQQQAESEAAAEAADEADLLQFAEALSWEQLVGQMDDEQLAAAFKELDLAEQQAASGDPAADKQWQRCFVTALNHAVMKDVCAARLAAGSHGQGGSQCGDERDMRSEVSSASQARRAEAVAARRQTLVQRLARLAGPAAAGGGSGSVLGGSTAVESCGRSQLGEQRGAGASPAAVDNWDRSTRAGGDDVAQLQTALKTLDAGEVLSENPEMKGVHSVASTRSMLQKLDGRGLPQPGGCCS